jgi:hypothetical protein
MICKLEDLNVCSSYGCDFLMVPVSLFAIRGHMELPRMDAIQHTENIRQKNHCIPMLLRILRAALEKQMLLEWGEVV